MRCNSNIRNCVVLLCFRLYNWLQTITQLSADLIHATCHHLCVCVDDDEPTHMTIICIIIFENDKCVRLELNFDIKCVPYVYMSLCQKNLRAFFAHQLWDCEIDVREGTPLVNSIIMLNYWISWFQCMVTFYSFYHSWDDCKKISNVHSVHCWFSNDWMKITCYMSNIRCFVQTHENPSFDRVERWVCIIRYVRRHKITLLDNLAKFEVEFRI